MVIKIAIFSIVKNKLKKNHFTTSHTCLHCIVTIWQWHRHRDTQEITKN